MKNNAHKEIYLPEIVGRGYKQFWNFKGRYRIVKGSRASKKSKTAALNFIYNMMKYPAANLLVVRKTFRTLKDSCFTELKWAIHRFNCDRLWAIKESPLEMTYIPTGQKIFFRGLDDPLKVTSITVDVGSLCWLWIEEAYEITSESDFDVLDESIRGVVPDGLYKQITMTFNPWNERHWIKHRFFDEIAGTDANGKPIYKPRETVISADGEIFAATTNYLCNEFLDEADFRVFERMKLQNPRRYQVAGLGNWGIAEGLIYENWEEKAFDLNDIRAITGIRSAFGMDFGYTNDPSTLFCGMFDTANKTIYVFDEMYGFGMSNEQIFKTVEALGHRKEKIVADSASPKDIAELRRLGLTRITAARKGKDSINNGIQFLQNFHIVIHPRCVNFLTEISNYTWDKDKFGNAVNKPIDGFNHLMDAMRYAAEQFIRGGLFSFE